MIAGIESGTPVSEFECAHNYTNLHNLHHSTNLPNLPNWSALREVLQRLWLSKKNAKKNCWVEPTISGLDPTINVSPMCAT